MQVVGPTNASAEQTERGGSAPAPGAEQWPVGGLERVATCPVCGAAERDVLYDGLTDRVFGCAPGEWTLYRCMRCAAAYLDPRPTAATIALAYRDYYTHDAPADDAAIKPTGWKRRFRNALRNTHLNRRLGYSLQPDAPAALVRFALLTPGARARAERFVRNLPRQPDRSDDDAMVLDVGCGSGWFLKRMKYAGWRASGVDPDARAVARARQSGLDARVGDLVEQSYPSGSFSAVTLNHVIEHLPNPVAVLRECFRVLRPGGVLWIATPNLNSAGHVAFRRNWLALDPPRHLVLFNSAALSDAVAGAGFELLPEPLPVPQAVAEHAASARLAAGRQPFDASVRIPAGSRVRALLADLAVVAARSHRRGEELVLMARKPKGEAAA